LFDWQKKINNRWGDARFNPHPWGDRGRWKNDNDAELLARLEWQDSQTPGWMDGPDYSHLKANAESLGYGKFQWYKNMVSNGTDPLGKHQSALTQHFYDTVSTPYHEQFGPLEPDHNPEEWKKQKAAEDAFGRSVFQKLTR
jgi:hypothetical protein